MTPAEPHRTMVWPLADLFDALRREGFQVRPDDYLEVVHVLATFQPQSYNDLQALISPLLVTSSEEQEKFDRIFEAVLRRKELEPVVRAMPRKPLLWQWLVVGLVGVLLLVYAAFFLPGPAFKTEIHLFSASNGPFSIGDTLVFTVDSTLRQAAGRRANWKWERPTGESYPDSAKPELRVVVNEVGPFVVNLRSQRRRGLLGTFWTDSLRGIEVPICDRLPVVQIDSIRLSTNPLRYRFRARLSGSGRAVQLTQWQFNGGVVASKQSVWEHTFETSQRSDGSKAFADVRFIAFPDTARKNVCFADASLSILISTETAPPFTIDVQQTGNSIKPETKLNTDYLWILRLVGGLLTLVVIYYFWLAYRDALKKRTAPPQNNNLLSRFSSDNPPLEIPLENRDEEFITRDQSFYRIVRLLRQPKEGEIRRLHIGQTMQATMREGGFPMLIYQPSLGETEYLFLIDRSQVRSQQVALFEYLFQAFLQESVCVERFFFHKSFDKFTNEAHPKGRTLRQLADSYRTNVLIVWSNGYPLLYPPYPVVEPPIHAALAEWESKALLTPVPFGDWGAKERALQADFLLLPADLTGQLRLMQALAEKQLRQDDYLHQRSQELYSTAYVDFQFVDELHDYLGETLFQWLAGIAIYPRIRWEVVVGIGQALLPPDELNFTNLLRLVRISWMHDGAFPDETRLELLKALLPENEAKARQTLLQMLTYAEQYFPGEHFYDGEKYLLETVNQFTLYAYDSEKYADYQSAQQVFKTLYEDGLYRDGATLRYLENPTGDWTTLLPAAEPPGRFQMLTSAVSRSRSVRLQEYLNEISVANQSTQPEPPADDSTIPFRRYILMSVGALLIVFLGLLYLRPRYRQIDLNQQIPVIVVLDTSACVTTANTVSGSGTLRWSIYLNDSLLRITNLTARRSLPLRSLITDSAQGLPDSVALRATLAVSDSAQNGFRQYSTVNVNGDTIRVRINCHQAEDQPVAPTVYIQYAARDQIDKARQLQTRLNASGFSVPGIELQTSFRDSTQVRYFTDSDRSEADSVASLVKRAFQLRTVRVVKVSGTKKAPVEVWLNLSRNTITKTVFSCQPVQSSWVNQFNKWLATTADGGTQTLNISGNDVRISNESLDAGPQVDPKTGKMILLGSALSIDNIGSVVRICQQNGVYLVQTTSREGKALFVRSVVTGRSCAIAKVNLNTNLLNSAQGQTYFDRLLRNATFIRFARPTPKPVRAATEGTGNTPEAGKVDRQDPSQSTEQRPPTDNQQRATQQAALPDTTQQQPAQDKGQQTPYQMANPVQSSTENLRIESQQSVDGLVQEGISAYRAGKYARAIELYDESLRKKSKDAYTLTLKAYSLFKLSRYQEAERILLTAIKANSRYAWAYFDLARVYCAMGKSDQATPLLDQAIRLQSDMKGIIQNDKEFMSLCGASALFR